MCTSINKNLNRYYKLQDLKIFFRNRVLDETGWSRSSFYNKMAGQFSISQIEQQRIDALFILYEKQLLKIKNLPNA